MSTQTNTQKQELSGKGRSRIAIAAAALWRAKVDVRAKESRLREAVLVAKNTRKAKKGNRQKHLDTAIHNLRLLGEDAAADALMASLAA